MEKRGVRKLILTGVKIGTYHNGNRNIVDIVDALNLVGGITRIRISSIEPTTIPLELFERMKDPESTLSQNYLHIPLQAGADEVLKRMRRFYSHGK